MATQLELRVFRADYCPLVHDSEGIPQGLKPETLMEACAARLKSCPDTKLLEAGG